MFLSQFLACLVALWGQLESNSDTYTRIHPDAGFHRDRTKYSQTWVNAHLRITTTCLQRPLFRGPNFNFHNIKLPLNNDPLPTTATNFGSLGWSLYTMTLFRSFATLKRIATVWEPLAYGNNWSFNYIFLTSFFTLFQTFFTPNSIFVVSP
jgi:hypothetical protein